MEKRCESTCGRSSGHGLFRLVFLLPVAVVLYVLSIGPAVRLGANNSEMAILLYKPIGWTCHQSKPFDRFVTKWIRLWDRPPFRRSWREALRPNEAPASNRRPLFPLGISGQAEYGVYAPHATPAAVAEAQRSLKTTHGNSSL
jgi:hypothetical protein